MFGLPDAKRVRRDELDASFSSESGESSSNDDELDAQLRERLNAHVAQLLALDNNPGTTSLEAASGGPRGVAISPDQKEGNLAEEPQVQEEEFEFRLFATSSAAPKVVLADEDTALQGEGGFVVPQRPLGFYLAETPTEKQAENFRAAAVTGEDVVRRSTKRCWGLELPWRVTSITVTRKQQRALAESLPNVTVGYHEDDKDEDEVVAQKRKRPGKKRRIALRTKERARKEKVELEAKQQSSKEEHLKEKKKRLNREKKLKRRQKKRDEKTTKAVDTGDRDDGQGAESVDSPRSADETGQT